MSSEVFWEVIKRSIPAVCVGSLRSPRLLNVSTIRGLTQDYMAKCLFLFPT